MPLSTDDMSPEQNWQEMVALYQLQKHISDPIKVWVSPLGKFTAFCYYIHLLEFDEAKSVALYWSP